jgi:hypothetical protein
MGKFDKAEKELQILREPGSGAAGELAEFIEKIKAKNSCAWDDFELIYYR